MHEFNTLWEVETPQGWGHAILIETTPTNQYWTVILAETRAIVTFRQDQLRITRNYTMNWDFSDKEFEEIINSATKRTC